MVVATQQPAQVFAAGLQPGDVIVVPKADGEGLTDGAIERQARMTGIARVVVEIECENTGVGAEVGKVRST